METTKQQRVYEVFQFLDNYVIDFIYRLVELGYNTVLYNNGTKYNTSIGKNGLVFNESITDTVVCIDNDNYTVIATKGQDMTYQYKTSELAIYTDTKYVNGRIKLNNLTHKIVEGLYYNYELKGLTDEDMGYHNTTSQLTDTKLGKLLNLIKQLMMLDFGNNWFIWLDLVVRDADFIKKVSDTDIALLLKRYPKQFRYLADAIQTYHMETNSQPNAISECILRAI